MTPTVAPPQPVEQTAEATIRRLAGELAQLKEQRKREALAALHGEAGALKRADALSGRIATLETEQELAALALEAAAEQAVASRAQRKAAALAQLEQMFNDLERRRQDAVDEVLDAGERVTGPLLDGTAALMRQHYGLAHDLYALTRNRKFSRSWAPRSTLSEELCEKTPYLARASAFAGRPPISEPWQELLAIASEES